MIDVYAIAPVAGQVNDSYVQVPAIVSTDTAIYGKRTYQGGPGIARVGNRIWAAWTADTKPSAWEGPGNFIVLVYSDNAGLTWSPETYLAPANPTTDRAFLPTLWLAPDGKLWVLYAQGGNGQIIDGQFGSWATVISNPLAAKPTFEPGFWLADGVPCSPFKVGSNWYLPSDYYYITPRFPSRAGKVLFGLDWANHKAAQVGYVPRSRNADFDESTYIGLKDGSVLSQSRSYGGILQSQSAPGTFTFPAPQLWGKYIAAPSRHVLTRSPTGRLVMVWNMSDASRSNMSIALSEDEGKTWSTPYTFDTRTDISYPAVDFNPNNGNILITYDHSRAGAREIVLARINEGKLAAGAPVALVGTLNKPRR